jgi:hypothetical protein
MCFGRAAGANSGSRSGHAPPVISVDDQIANDLYPISFVILDLHACDFLNQDYQFKTIKPISAQIAVKISIISDTPYVDV